MKLLPCRSVALLALLVCPAQAQSGADRKALQSLTDSLVELDAVALAALAKVAEASARTDRSDPLGHLRLGIIRLHPGINVLR